MRPWLALRRLSNRTPLRTKLITALLALVIVALAAISVSSVWMLRSYLSQQTTPRCVRYEQSNGQTVSLEPGQTHEVHSILVGVERQEPRSAWPVTSIPASPRRRQYSRAVASGGAYEPGLDRGEQRKAGDRPRPVWQ